MFSQDIIAIFVFRFLVPPHVPNVILAVVCSQLGHGDTLKRSRPVQISSLADKGIVAVECGQYHSLALSDDHR